MRIVVKSESQFNAAGRLTMRGWLLNSGAHVSSNASELRQLTLWADNVCRLDPCAAVNAHWRFMCSFGAQHGPQNGTNNTRQKIHDRDHVSSLQILRNVQSKSFDSLLQDFTSNSYLCPDPHIFSMSLRHSIWNPSPSDQALLTHS